MQENIPILIIDPVILFREGMSRILYEAKFYPIWCSDRSPMGPIASVPERISPLLIIGSEIDEAIIYIADVRRCYPTSRVVLLTDPSSQAQILTALQCGADAILHRHSTCETLIGTLRLVPDGVAVLPTDLLQALLVGRVEAWMRTKDAAPVVNVEPAIVEPPPELCGLSTRELSVLYQLVDGLPNKEIARRLNIAEATVKVHIKAILRKARLHNRTQVAMWASRVGRGLTLSVRPRTP